LKHFAGQPAGRNELAEALAQFNELIGTFPNSPLLGKAYLDRAGATGWRQNPPKLRRRPSPPRPVIPTATRISKPRAKKSPR